MLKAFLTEWAYHDFCLSGIFRDAEPDAKFGRLMFPLNRKFVSPITAAGINEFRTVFVKAPWHNAPKVKIFTGHRKRKFVNFAGVKMTRKAEAFDNFSAPVIGCNSQNCLTGLFIG